MANEGRILSEAGRKYIKEAEDRNGIPSLRAYNDGTGTWTGPWGITHGVQPGQVFSMAQAVQLFEAEIAHVELGLQVWCHVEVTQGLWDALVSFGYNNGWGKCGTLQNAVNSGDEARTRAAWMLFVHAHDQATGQTIVWPGLVHRRQAELALWYREDHDPMAVVEPRTTAAKPPRSIKAEPPPVPNIVATAVQSRTVWAQITTALGVLFGLVTKPAALLLGGVVTAAGDFKDAVPDIQTNIDTSQQVAGWFGMNGQDVALVLVGASIAYTIVRRALDKQGQVL